MSKEHKVHKEVIVIGAGISGIAAAAELVKNGKDVLVLEGRERLGGRIHTDRKSGSEPYELGACWFHQSDDNPLKDIAKEHGIAFEDDNGVVKTVGEDGEFPESLNLKGAAKEFAAFAKDQIKGDDISLRALIDQFVRENKDLSKDQIKLLPTVLRAPQISHGVDWTLVSGKQLADAPKGKDLLVTGGYDKIYEAVRGDVKDDQIVLGAAVKSIDSTDPTKVVLETADYQYTADHVICTIPVAVLKSQHVFFKPELPAGIKNAIEEITIAEVGKSYVEFDEQFWIDGDKFLYAGQYPFVVSNWGKYGGKKENPGLAIISTAPLTRPIEGAADEEAAFKLLEPVLAALRKDHSKPVPKPKKVTVTNWTTDIFSQGSYSTFTVGTDRSAAVNAFAKGVGRVRFAGEHTIVASQGATFAHGAYRSGVREAKHVLSQLSILHI